MVTEREAGLMKDFFWLAVVAAGMVAAQASLLPGEEPESPATGSYQNPVGGPDLLMGDPFALRDDDTYFLFGTNGSDGFRYWTSPDLVHWQPQGYAFQRSPGDWGDTTFWAPEVAMYRGQAYLIFSSQPSQTKAFDARICVAVAETPAGPFQLLHAPWFETDQACIDGHLFVDDDGTPYLFFSYVGAVGNAHDPDEDGYLFAKIYGARLKEDLSDLAETPKLCLEADQPWELTGTSRHPRTRTTEGAFVFRENDTYYMTYSSHHYTDPKYGIGYATASSPLGPWTKSADNPLVQAAPEIGVSGPGHSSITTSPDGSERFLVYHTHANPEAPSGRRTVNIDRLEIDKDGKLRVLGPTRSLQPLPSGVPETTESSQTSPSGEGHREE